MVDPCYLSDLPVLDFKHPDIAAQATSLSQGCTSARAIVERCFLFVRDRIHHTIDIQGGPVTCSAREVLLAGSGYCYAKSHLLAALLRANGIPTAFCYQRLRLDGPETPFCLHGLNAVHLAEFGWVRLDARGNKPGVNAQFMPPTEHLAFPLVHPGERTLPDYYPAPLPVVLHALATAPDWLSLLHNLPDSAD